MPRTIRFHLDEHCPHAVAIGLRRLGIDVTTTTDAVITIFRANPYQKIRSADTARGYLRLRLTSTGGPLLIV